MKTKINSDWFDIKDGKKSAAGKNFTEIDGNMIRW